MQMFNLLSPQYFWYCLHSFFSPQKWKEVLRVFVSKSFNIFLFQVLKVAILSEKFAVDYTWYVDTILNLIRIAGDYVSEEVSSFRFYWINGEIKPGIKNCVEVRFEAIVAIMGYLQNEVPFSCEGKVMKFAEKMEWSFVSGQSATFLLVSKHL